VSSRETTKGADEMTTRQRVARRAEETAVWIGRNMLRIILLVALACTAIPMVGQAIIEARELVAEAQGLLAKHGLAWEDVLTVVAGAAFLYWMMVLEDPKRRFDRRDDRPGHGRYRERRDYHHSSHRR
jgi:hypothetical protein